MRTFKEKTVEVLDDVNCDVCGKSTTNHKDVGPDYATLESCWGYGSRNDGSKYSIDICESCFNETLEFLKQKRRSVLGPFSYPFENDPLSGNEYL
jgi:hypothetical protein